MTPEPETDDITIALDIHDVGDGPKDAAIFRGLLELKGCVLFKTKRGRFAAMVPLLAFERLRRRLSFFYEDGLDGLKHVISQDK